MDLQVSATILNELEAKINICLINNLSWFLANELTLIK